RMIAVPTHCVRVRKGLALAGASTLVFTGCSSGTDTITESEAPPTESSSEPDANIVATTTIWADIASRSLCGLEVASVIPAGADPHTFETSLADRATLEQADLVVANGLALEEGLVDLLATVADGGTPVIEMTEAVAIRDMGDDHDDEHSDDKDHADEHHDEDEDHGDDEDHDHDDKDHADEHHHDHSGSDPHIWLDPINVASTVNLITEAAIDAGFDTSVRACAQDFIDEIEALDTEIADDLSAIPSDRRFLVTNHDALGYFAERYGFEVVGTVIPSLSTLAETNPADLADLAAIIEELDIPTVFSEEQASARDADALADAIPGLTVVALDTGSLRDTDDDYLSMMRRNVTAIAEALG
ncbi:MAG: metal ABC transporter substrate-binding protein, partial [Ilumatobacteraceae bacterium]